MQYNKIRKILTSLVIIFAFLNFFDLMLYIGSGGILNELDFALEEIEDLEKKNLLKNPPENISAITKAELETFHNSAGLKQYIKEYEESLYYRDIYSYIIISLFFIIIILRIYFRKGKKKESTVSLS